MANNPEGSNDLNTTQASSEIADTVETADNADPNAVSPAPNASTTEVQPESSSKSAFKFLFRFKGKNSGPRGGSNTLAAGTTKAGTSSATQGGTKLK